MSFFPQIEAFLNQAETSNLKTKGLYDNEYRGLTVRVSFGQGNPARIPWIAFLRPPNEVSHGIYPVYLYFKSLGKLILAYGLSETQEPDFSWQLNEKPPTINEFFEAKGYPSPSRYNDSLVFKEYEVNALPDQEEMDAHLAEIMEYYTSIDFSEEEKVYEKDSKQRVDGVDEDHQVVLDVLHHVHQYIQSKGFTFSPTDIKNFFLSLKTKPFVILAGISGTGKSKLPQLFLEALGRKEHCVILPVRPDWTDNSDLIGYVDLQGRFQPKELTRIFLEANARPEEPFFLVLDEMNLARVEYYFSDFLSIIESRERDSEGTIRTHPILAAGSLERSEDRKQYEGLGIPPNVYIIGTVNMDETTHAFSRKVLDRANSIEMNTVVLQWPDFVAEPISPLDPPIDHAFFQTPFLSPLDLTDEDRSGLQDFIPWLSAINAIMEKADLHFGYRVRNEMGYYLALNQRFGLLEEREARDLQLMQKVLPRIQGSSRTVKVVLLGLLQELEGIVMEAEDFTLEALQQRLPATADFLYPLSTKKILFMLTRFENDGFTSYWL